MPSPKETHVFTMVYDEEDYLEIWLRHWRAHLPDSCLHVLIHGENEALQRLAGGVNVEVIERPEPYETMEEDRWKMISERVSRSAADGNVAVYTDVDEILIADPRGGVSLVELLERGDAPVRHVTGLEIIHRTDVEPAPIDIKAGILQQREYHRPSSFYSKPCIIRQPVVWGRGGHFADKPGMKFAKDIYSIHLRFYDMDKFLVRAEARRTTTKSTKVLMKVSHRKWRNSAQEARKLVAQLQDMPLPRTRSLSLWRLRWRMWRTNRQKFRRRNDGLYRYELFAGKLQKMPEWMLDLL